MPELLQQTIDYIHALPTVIKILALILAVAIEYVFPLFPGDTIVIFAGFLNAYQALELFEIGISIVVGTLLGATAAYTIGKMFVSSQAKSSFIEKLVSSSAYRNFDSWYKKWGAIFLLLNRFFPGIRSLFFFAAGMQKLSLLKVLVLGGISAVLFNTCLLALGYIVGFNADLIMKYFYRYNTVALVFIFFIGVCVAIFFWRKSRR